LTKRRGTATRKSVRVGEREAKRDTKERKKRGEDLPHSYLATAIATIFGIARALIGSIFGRIEDF